LNRNTIDFGIDLGTTTSIVAVANEDEIHIFQTEFGTNFLPSVVRIYKGQTTVGERAKNKIHIDKENTHSEFKVFMGTDTKFKFKDSEIEMKPEELSAEVLKKLKHIVHTKSKENMQNAVITVPADFKTHQSAATDKAAKIAGFNQHDLIQEPVAAAYAYGAQNISNNSYWMIYDFGGGTFDAAIVKILDGQLTILKNRGDNNLGGKIIDWDIVNKILAPQVRKNYNVTEFNRKNPKWIKAFAILKMLAEEVKKILSEQEEAYVDSDTLGIDNDGEDILLECTVKRKELKAIMDPLIDASIRKCEEALEAAHLKSSAINKMIMVGGQTLSPYLREKVLEKTGISQEYQKDPVTVVAQGAAIYASTILASKIIDDHQTYEIEQISDAAGNSLEPMIAGIVKAPQNKSLEGYTITIIGEGIDWSSETLNLRPSGNFRSNALAEEGLNRYKIVLADPLGNILPTSPEKLTYRYMVNELPEQTLTNSIGLGLADETYDVILTEDSPLPTASERRVYATQKEVLKGSDEFINIPIYEGNNTQKADRNQHLGSLVVKGKNMKMTLPRGSEVEIIMEVDESRLIKCKAYIPVLQVWEEGIIDTNESKIDLNELRSDYIKENERLLSITSDPVANNNDCQRIIAEINNEKLIEQIKEAIYSDDVGEESLIECESRLRTLKNLLDIAEDIVNIPKKIQKFQAEYDKIKQYIEGQCPERLFDLENLHNDLEATIANKDIESLEVKMKEVYQIQNQCLFNDCNYLIARIKYLDLNGTFDEKKEALAKNLIAEAKKLKCPEEKYGLQSSISQIEGMLKSQIAPNPQIQKDLMKF